MYSFGHVCLDFSLNVKTVLFTDRFLVARAPNQTELTSLSLHFSQKISLDTKNGKVIYFIYFICSNSLDAHLTRRTMLMDLFDQIVPGDKLRNYINQLVKASVMHLDPAQWNASVITDFYLKSNQLLAASSDNKFFTGNFLFHGNN